MEHHFDIELACEIGVEKAILLHNLIFWVQHNEANETHQYEGHTWTFNSAKAFTRLMPYFKRRSISRWLQELEDEGYLISSSNFNQTPYDRTKWYALGPKIEERGKLPESREDENGQSNDKKIDCGQNAQLIGQNSPLIGQNGQQNSQSGQPIPDSKPIVKTDRINTDKRGNFLKTTSENNLISERKMSPEQRTAYLEEARRSVETRRLAKKAAYDAVAKKRFEKELVGVSGSPGREPWEQG